MISPHLHWPEISLYTTVWNKVGVDALWEVRHRASGSESDSSCQYFSFSDVVRGMEAEGRNKTDIRSVGLLPPT